MLFLTAVVAIFHYDSLLGTYSGAYHPSALMSLAGVIIPLLLLFSAGLLIFGLVFHLLVYASGGREGMERTLAVLLYAATPLLLTLWIFEIIWMFQVPVSPFIFPVFILWPVILAVIGIRVVHDISVFRASVPFFLLLIIVLEVRIVCSIQLPKQINQLIDHIACAMLTD